MRYFLILIFTITLASCAPTFEGNEDIFGGYHPDLPVIQHVTCSAFTEEGMAERMASIKKNAEEFKSEVIILNMKEFKKGESSKDFLAPYHLKPEIPSMYAPFNCVIIVRCKEPYTSIMNLTLPRA